MAEAPVAEAETPVVTEAASEESSNTAAANESVKGSS